MIHSDHGELTPSELALELLRERVADNERRYGIPSADLHDAIERGDLTETDEVCDWIIEHEVLLRVLST